MGPHMAGASFLEVSEVSRAASFDVSEGESLSIVGPSGCGKSTLVMLIAGLLPPTSGAIVVAGSVVDRPQTNRGIVFQSPVLLAWRRARDNVLLQIERRGRPAGEYRERARALLASVGRRARGWRRRTGTAC